jgi:hypothetical protein
MDVIYILIVSTSKNYQPILFKYSRSMAPSSTRTVYLDIHFYANHFIVFLFSLITHLFRISIFDEIFELKYVQIIKMNIFRMTTAKCDYFIELNSVSSMKSFGLKILLPNNLRFIPLFIF